MPEKILIVRRDNIGDLVCTTPLIAVLRRAYPKAHLAALVNSYNVAVLAGNPHLDAVYAYDKAKHKPGESRLRLYWQRWKLLRHLRRQRFDWAIVGGGEPRHGVRLARMAGARQVAAFVVPGKTLDGVDFPVEFDGVSRHEVLDTLRLLAPLGVAAEPVPALTLRADAAVADRLAGGLPAGWAGLPRKIAVHISARKVSQRWPEDRFAELIRRLLANGVGVMLLWAPGSAADPAHPGDDEKAAAVRARVGDATAALAAVATTTLPELVAALSLVDGMVCADGGAMHLAAGLGKPVVALFGGSDATRWHPWGVPYRVLQPPSREVVDVSLDDVLAAACELFAITNSG